MSSLDLLPALNVDLNIYRGDTIEPVVHQITDSVGVPINITGWTFAAQIRPDPDSDTVIAAFTCVITDALNGFFTIEMDSSLTSLLTKKKAFWDLQRTDLPGHKRTLISGKVFTTRDVSKP